MHHHSEGRSQWLKQLFSFRGSVFLRIAPAVGSLSLLAWGMTWLEHREHLPQLPIAPFTVLGTALGLLLTLRTNASYDRYWEGRKAWGSMVNRCRNLARQAATTFADPQAEQAFGRLLSGFAHSVKRQLWRSAEMPELERLFGPGWISLRTAPGPAQRCLLLLGREVRARRLQNQIHAVEQRAMEEDLTALIDALGVCERIQRTPIPLGYVLHLRRFLVIYCLALTLALVDPLGWYSPLVTGFVAYVFLGIERVGIEIEDPFGRGENSLDLEAISGTIERDVTSCLGDRVAPP